MESEKLFLRLADECSLSGVDFRDLVCGGLSKCLGPAVAQAVMYHVGCDRLSTPREFVDRLSALFRQGTTVLLRSLVSEAQNALREKEGFPTADRPGHP